MPHRGDFNLQREACNLLATRAPPRRRHRRRLLITLPSGSFTAQITGANATTGTTFVEIHEVR